MIYFIIAFLFLIGWVVWLDWRVDKLEERILNRR
jgi:hypothetical protein